MNIKSHVARFWTKYIVAEDPEDRARRIRYERIENIKRDVELLDAMKRAFER